MKYQNVAFSIVLDTEGRVLVVSGRRGWMLPGGLLNLGETFYDAAKRELKEESGYKINILPIPLPDSKANVQFFGGVFDFASLSRKIRNSIFHSRSHKKETKDYGFLRFFSDGSYVVEEHDGNGMTKRKACQKLRRGTYQPAYAHVCRSMKC